MTMQKQKITPFLWFDTQAEEASKFYLSVFKDGKVTATTYYGPEGPGPKGSVMTMSFELNGQEFVALNGGPNFKFTEAISFVINCETQKEVDYYWDKLIEGGGKHLECGWLKDKYGLAGRLCRRCCGT
jgi:predicted 3-demethylubiquinone-9 3-methyltransferase (glyoxalase superfamily)